MTESTIEQRLKEGSHGDLVILTSYMADHDYNSAEIAYAVEKPWKHGDVFVLALEALEALGGVSDG